MITGVALNIGKREDRCDSIHILFLLQTHSVEPNLSHGMQKIKLTGHWIGRMKR